MHIILYVTVGVSNLNFYVRREAGGGVSESCGFSKIIDLNLKSQISNNIKSQIIYCNIVNRVRVSW